MVSNILNGERRWPSGRRSGMTVLGKVVVPKPMNLPSQRLENLVLDQDVEIVPKGTHTWGCRPPSSTANAWGPSLPSSADGSSSLNHVNLRPSSAGSESRPSTAGSERAREVVPYAQGPNSRPLSASAALMSEQAPFGSLRPRSAETRPGSSQLSRFADCLPNNAIKWDVNGMPEKLGVMPANADGFSATPGDFPMLGSEKESSIKYPETQDIVRGSAGRNASTEENQKNGGSSPTRYACGPNLEKWHCDSQLYPSSAFPHLHHNAWHDAPNGHSALWYGGPPFVPPLPPGSFGMDPFPYYCPQYRQTVASNQQTVPSLHCSVPGGHPLQNSDSRPLAHSTHAGAAMQFRPGFFTGPVHCGHSMGYCNPCDGHVPFMGTPMCPYNMFSGQNSPAPCHVHGVSNGYSASGSVVIREEAESHLLPLPQGAGNGKALLEEDDSKKSPEGIWRPVHLERDMSAGCPLGEEASVGALDDGGAQSQSRPTGLVENLLFIDVSDKLEVSKQPVPLLEGSASSKDASLIQKIKCLNVKVRATDSKQDPKSPPPHVGLPATDDAKTGHASNAAARSLASPRSLFGIRHGLNHGKVRAGSLDANWSVKLPQVTDPATAASDSYAEGSEDPVEKFVSYSQGADLTVPMPSTSELSGSQKQHAKMRVLAKEGTRNQNATALVRLEELSRNIKTEKGGSNQDVESVQGAAALKVDGSSAGNQQERKPTGEAFPNPEPSNPPLRPTVHAECGAQHHFRRKNKYGKGKHRTDAEIQLDVSAVQPPGASRGAADGNKTEARSQISRRVTRNGQVSSRPGDKMHGMVQWVPARKTVVAVDPVGPPLNNDQQIPGVQKMKRAEIERYVPKPVAKEMMAKGVTAIVPSADSGAPSGVAGAIYPEQEPRALQAPSGDKSSTVASRGRDGRRYRKSGQLRPLDDSSKGRAADKEAQSPPFKGGNSSENPNPQPESRRGLGEDEESKRMVTSRSRGKHGWYNYRNENQNRHFNREYESRAEWDEYQPTQPHYRGRRAPIMHYEYQPVSFQKKYPMGRGSRNVYVHRAEGRVAAHQAHEQF